MARAIPHLSARCNKKPFVALDCGAIRRPSLFLDEIANLSLSTQAKLLRILQEREVQPRDSKQPIRVDVRIIAASNSSLDHQLWRRRHGLSAMTLATAPDSSAPQLSLGRADPSFTLTLGRRRYHSSAPPLAQLAEGSPFTQF
jgi:hypothetical protein